ncbi:MAG: signal peptidase II [Lachnospiraceae bacterium]|nr:signal peptidase II [Lachnospiraceae bacterium]
MKKNEYNRVLMLITDLVIAVALMIFDQYSKQLAIANLKGKEAIVLIDEWLQLEYLENRGSAFGILQNQKLFILFISLIFMGFMVFFILRLPLWRKFVFAHVFLSMIISGGIGNAIDRLKFDYVVDFIYVVKIRFPIFNFADCCVVVGVFGMLFLFLFVYKESDLDFLKFKRNRRRELGR